MENHVGEHQKSGVLMNAQEVEEWKQDYENAQGWADQENLNQRRRDEGKKMAYDQQNNRISLWKQEKRSENSPAYSGKGLVNGKEWSVGCWRNTVQTGEHKGLVYLGLKFEEPKDRGDRPHEEPTEEPDIPF